jgi:hypothetical protein
MKRLKYLLAALATTAVFALSVSASVALAGNGKSGAGLAAHLTHIDAKVAKHTQKCKVADAPAKCAEKKAKLTTKLNAFEARLDEKIMNGGDATNAAQLTSARDHVAELVASL